MNWDHIKSNVKKAAEKTADQLNYSADLASLQLKLSVEERKLEQAYVALGKAAYQHFSDAESSADEVASAMLVVEKELAAVKTLRIRLLTLKKQRVEKRLEQAKKDAEATQGNAPEAEEKQEIVAEECNEVPAE